MRIKEYDKFISKFKTIGGETDKNMHYVLEVKKFPKKTERDRNICIIEHWIDESHGKNRCIEEDAVWLNEEDLKKIIEKINNADSMPDTAHATYITD